MLLAAMYWLGRASVYANAPVRLDQAYITNTNPTAQHDAAAVDFGIFWDAWDVVRRKYVDHDQLHAQDLIYGAIRGMLAATGDPYTTFFDAEELSMFNEELTGTFEGIGAEIGMRDGVLTIVAPLDGAPAQRAGLRPGDAIVKIDGASTAQMSIDKAVSLIRGPRGTQVVLTIYRDGADDTQDITVTRDEIIVQSVTSTVEDGTVGVIRVRRFGPETAAAFEHAITTLVQNPDVRALVIDVRNNPGGYLEAAVRMAGLMLPPGATVVMSEDSNDQRKSYFARGSNIAGAMPTVVLINEGSASASEILAGALRDNRDDVVLVGRKSFGKGSVQELIPLKSGAVKVTIAKWLTPNGDQINGVGITPDEDVERTEEDFVNDRDPQKERAVERAQELLRQRT